MTNPHPFNRFHLLASLVAAFLASTAGGATPTVFWESDPVRPNETVMVHGSDLGASSATVEMARLDAPDAHWKWEKVQLLQAGEQTLKFVVPSSWKMGVFAYRITTTLGAGPLRLLNCPNVWWFQGDEGESATPGGWLRVLGQSLSSAGRPSVILRSEKLPPVILTPTIADDFSIRVNLPADLKPDTYTVQIQNDGGRGIVSSPGSLTIIPAIVPPSATFSVLETYGPDAVNKMRATLIKYDQPLDRTEGILAALKKAKDGGGGIVYFPAGRYLMKGPMEVPPHTIVRGEGMGLVTLWWGSGHFNLDGGGPQGRVKVDEPKPPHTLIGGPDFEISDMSLFLPLDYEQGIVAERRLRMSRVKIRIDHYWLVQGRGNGAVARLGKNFQVADCDILAKGDGLVPGQFGVISHNRIMANKCNTPMGGSNNLIVEENQFVSMDPTTYQNISGSGRNIYYGHNRHEALYAQQSDYSFTFDAATGCYVGPIAVDGTKVTLPTEPAYPKWAPEQHKIWTRAALFIIDGHGVGQWRDITANHGRSWEIDRPFDVSPDATSVATICSFNGRTLIVNNHFEDGNWVNAGYGTSIDVICANNHLSRCADMMNYGLHSQTFAQPSWHVQYFDNEVTEGQTHVGSSGDGHKSELFNGPLTRWVVHRRHNLSADNSGSITLGGNVVDAVIEGCTLRHLLSQIKVDGSPEGVVLRDNKFEGADSPRYVGDGVKKAAGIDAK